MEEKNMALEIVRLYDKHFPNPEEGFHALKKLSNDDVFDLSKSGKLNSLVYLSVYADVLDQGGEKQRANQIRELSAGAQTQNLLDARGNKLEVFISPFFGNDANKLDYRLKDVIPYVCLEGEPFSYPFVDNRGGICAINDKENKTLFVNPHLFSSLYIDTLNNQTLSQTREEHAKEYDKFLRSSFGETNIEKTRPFLKEGRFVKF